MIPQRCYSDLFSLRDKVRRHSTDFAHNHMIVAECTVFITALDDIIRRWSAADDRELSDMAEEYEKSEKDCMWEGD